MAIKNLQAQAKNVESAEEFKYKSDNIKGLAKDLEKNTGELEKITRNQNWWCFSKWCMILFGGIALVIVIFVLIIYFSV